jgi:hypothetical protein
MQCSMRNHCSGLFTCIMNYLHVLCMILMVLSCVLCMTLMVFIYVYYGLFACTNLVDVMPLFSRFFHFIYQFSAEIVRFLPKFARKSPRQFSRKITDLSMKSAEFQYSRFSLFLCRLQWVSAEFSRISPIFPNFPKTDGIAQVRFSSFRRIFEHCLYLMGIIFFLFMKPWIQNVTHTWLLIWVLPVGFHVPVFILSSVLWYLHELWGSFGKLLPHNLKISVIEKIFLN